MIPAQQQPAQVVRVLRMPAVLDQGGVTELTNELSDAASSDTAVIVIAPVSAELGSAVGEDQLGPLAQASAHARLVILGSPGQVLPELRGNGVHVADYNSAKALEASLGDVQGVDHGTLAVHPLARLLQFTKNRIGTGHDQLILALVAALALVGLVLGGLLYARSEGRRPASLQRRTSSRRPASAPGSASRPSSPRQPAQSRRTITQLPQDPRLPTSGPALVRSELCPEGYVEFGGCLRHVRWADSRLAPPAVGEWVDVQRDSGRLLALPSRRTSNGRQ